MRRKRSKLTILKEKADGLYQRKYIKEKPRSIVSGQPTEVIHHVIQKSQSKFLRYDDKNGVPLTRAEHFAHHTKGEAIIMNTVIKNMGQEWFDDLQARRRIICKFNIGYLNDIIEKLGGE